MARVRRINVSQIEGNNANENEITDIRPLGEIGIYFSEYNGVEKPELLMFDGTRTHIKSKILAPGIFYGSGADSGEGSGADTIKLIPDASLHYNDGSFGNDQYLIVDPTGGEPGHIHLRAGGTIDSSTADLYLGGELTCVRVSDTSGIINIRTTNVGDPNITMNWAFEPDGNLYFPGIGNNRIGESEPGLVVSSDNSVVLQSNNGGESKELTFGVDGSLIFPNGAGQINPQVSDGVGLQIEADLDFEIKITSEEDTSIWSFAGGELTFPTASFGENVILPTIHFPVANTTGGYVGINLNGIGVQVLDSVWTFAPEVTGEGYSPPRLIFPDNTEQYTAWSGGRVVGVPDSSNGAIGDTVGDIAFSNQHFYYCITDYMDGESAIWKRVAWSNDTW